MEKFRERELNLVPPRRAAMKESKKSRHRFKMGAAICRGNKVLVKACNVSKTHPKFGSGFYRQLHAEGHAIYRAIRQGIDLRGTQIHIYRHNNNLAKPCPSCMKLIQEYGIKDVFYSS